MPLNSLQDTVRAGPASRKRTYDQITRSQSRSVTPPSSKRRRTNTSPPTTSPPRQTSSPPPSPPQRFVGDGLDFRRPTSSAMAQAQEQDAVDLTLDEDSDDGGDSIGLDYSPWSNSIDLSRDTSAVPSQPAIDRVRINLPPRPNQSQQPEMQSQSRTAPEVIELSDSEDDDVQIVGERQAPRRPVLPSPREIDRVLRTPPPELRRSNAQTFADTLRSLPSFFGLGRPDLRQPPAGPYPGRSILDHARAVLQQGVPPSPLNMGTYDDIDGLEEYDNITMDYGAPAFVIEDPGADDVVVEDYKPPTAAREGFTKDIDEEGDVLVCVGCEDELAAGDDEVKAQVWVSKKCGHVYCGACASRRVASRGGNDRDRKRKSKQLKLDELKHCKVEGCNQKLSAKTALFQVYL
ncbi:hypothetical protein OHC33_007691 [Knufia fluminis]|uniref:RING finger domain protein n=1 Tax=Knufia fluminis TaxID=191047 RepID=A0AAN8EBQ7_9EURO|nr:hypothetical protein OHC33_007691 [Knufia fluminis]